ncbi:MAG: heparinase II/III-family protein [Sedimenticola sp.]|nr:heparinase II/III-family protein [Sedimenticola sp.]
MSQCKPASSPKASFILVLFQRLISAGILGVVVFTLLDFPVANQWLATGLGLYFVLLVRFPWLWMIIVPTLLPVLDLTPTTGRIYFGEFDLLILVTIASGFLRSEAWITPLALSWRRWTLILLLVIWQSYTALKGLLPLQPIDANAFTSYYSHYNSLRLAKGFFWALLLLPLFGQAIARKNPVSKLLIIGIIGGLAADLMAILWERALFSGVFNFTKPYRVTALFSGMTTGGAPLDAHLIFSLPFISALFILKGSRLIHLVGFGLLLFTLYGLAVTFSRADYAAVLIAIVTGLSAWFYIKRHIHKSHHGKGWFLFGVILLALLIATPFISGEFIKHRFSTVSSDLTDRFVHWNSAISMMGNDPENQLLGMGRGAFPRHYYWSHPPESLPPTMLHTQEDANNFLRMDKSNKSGDLFLTQRFAVTEPGPYRLSISLRPRSDHATRLLVEICERLIYQTYNTCRWVGIDTGANSKEWISFNKTFSVKDLGTRYWYGSRPVQISILNRGLTEGLDIDDVQIITPSGKHLLENSSFDQGMDHWFFYSGNHLSWHIKNIWVDTFFEGGWIGLCIFTIFILYSLIIAIKRLRQRDSFPLFYLPALAGLLVVGLFDSILDEPKLTLLLFLCTWVLLASRSTALTLTLATAHTPGIAGKLLRQFRRQSLRFQGTLIAVALFGSVIGGVFLATQFTNMGARQLTLRVLDKLGQHDGFLVQAIVPNRYHSEHKLVGKIQSSHPRILIPELSQWSGLGIPELMKKRLPLYNDYDRKHYLPCSNNSLPGLTACWLSTGETATAERIINSLLTGYMQVARNNESYGNLWEYAFAYDFIRLYPDLKESDRIAIEARIRGALRHALLLLEGNNMSLWHGRSTLASIAWLAAIVLDPENPDDLNLITQAQGHFLETLKALAITEAWPEGYNYWINNRGFLITLAASAYLNSLEKAENHEHVKEILRRVGYWHIYNTRPDNKAHGLGDEGPRIDLKDETRRVIDLITQATRDPVLAAYSRYIGELYGFASYYQDYQWGFRLFNDPLITPIAQPTKETLSFAKSLPTAAIFGKGAMNMAYFRSGWSPQDTFITLRSGSNFTHHGHYDAGHFTLFKGAPLVSNSGTYGGFFTENRLNYSLRTVSKNSLLILRKDEEVKPNRFFKENVSAGGQRITMPTGSSISSTSEWAEQLNDGQHLEGGKLIAYDADSANSYHYLATDLTPAYNNTKYDKTGKGGKVSSVIREFLYLTEVDQLLIHDKIISTNPGYTKKWLLHTIKRPIMENIAILKGTESNGILESRSDNVKIANGTARLRVDRIYPEKAVTRLIGGPDYQYYVEMDGDDSDLDGKNMIEGVNKQPWFDDSQWRIEIQPEEAELEDHFLMVLTPSIDKYRDIKPSLLKTDRSNTYGTRSQASLILFLSDLNEGSISLMKKASDKTLYLLGRTPGSRITLFFNGNEKHYVANSAGVTVVKFSDALEGEIRIRL